MTTRNAELIYGCPLDIMPMYYHIAGNFGDDFTPHARARGKAISSVIVVVVAVDTKIAKS